MRSLDNDLRSALSPKIHLRDLAIHDDPETDEVRAKREWYLPIKLCLKPMQFFERISETEIRSLATRIQETQQVEDRNLLVLGTWGLASWFALHYRMRALDFEDAIQYSLIGLLKAADKYSPTYGTKFSTYAIFQMRSVVQRAVHDELPDIRIPVHAAEIVGTLRKSQHLLEQELGRFPSFEEIFETVPKSRKMVYRMLWHLNRPNLSLTDFDSLEPRTEGGIPRSFERCGDLNPEQVLIARAEILSTCKEIRDEIIRKIPRQKQRYLDIFRVRYGLNGTGEEKTLKEVGSLYKRTGENIRQIEIKAWSLICRRGKTYNPKWLAKQLKKITALEDLLGEDISSVFFREALLRERQTQRKADPSTLVKAS